MQIQIDTSLPLNDTERAVLSLLLGGEAVTPFPTPPNSTVEGAALVAGKPAAKKAAAKKAAAPEPEEEPEPMAEEPLEDEESEEESEADDVSDEDLLAMAIKKATEMVAGGDAAKVREALDAAGASRVRELNKDNVRDFFKALP